MTTPTKRRSCEGKRRHSKATARAEIARLENLGASPGRLEAYPCKHCPPYWHVGHTLGGRR